MAEAERRRKGFAGSSEIIDGLRRQLGLDENVYAIMQAWDREMGALARHVKLAGIKKGILVVDVASSAHMQEITLRRRELIDKLNQYLGGKKVVKGIRVQLEKTA